MMNHMVMMMACVLVMMSPFYAAAEVKIVTHTIRQPFGGSQSPDDARIAAVAKAKREALEMAGTYIESLTIVKNAQVDKDEVLALTAGVLSAEVLSQRNYATEDAFGVEIIVRVNVDTSVLEDRVKKLLDDRKHLGDLNRLRKREKELLDRMANLEEENRRLMTEKKSTVELKKQFQETSKSLTAVELVNKVYTLLTSQLKFSDPQKALEYTTEAIRLDPNYSDAYAVRSWVYLTMGLHEHAITDCSEAIRIKPDSFFAYRNRCWAYKELGQYERAIADCDKAVSIKPDEAWSYFNRAATYERMAFHSFFVGDRYDRAIKDFSEAIRWQPDFAQAYLMRGSIHTDRGDTQRGIQDLSEAIRLKPDFAVAYNNRGIAYARQSPHLGCPDFRKACELGYCAGLEDMKRKGYCR